MGRMLFAFFPVFHTDRTISIQHDLFDLGGELSIPGHRLISEAQVLALEQWLERYNATLPPLKEFILPGGSRAAALAYAIASPPRS